MTIGKISLLCNLKVFLAVFQVLGGGTAKIPVRTLNDLTSKGMKTMYGSPQITQTSDLMKPNMPYMENRFIIKMVVLISMILTTFSCLQRFSLFPKHFHAFYLVNKRPATLLKKRLWHRCFSVNFVKFPRTPFYKTPPDNCFSMNI